VLTLQKITYPQPTRKESRTKSALVVKRESIHGGRLSFEFDPIPMEALMASDSSLDGTAMAASSNGNKENPYSIPQVSLRSFFANGLLLSFEQ
jgi:hypothetical protein